MSSTVLRFVLLSISFDTENSVGALVLCAANLP